MRKQLLILLVLVLMTLSSAALVLYASIITMQSLTVMICVSLVILVLVYALFVVLVDYFKKDVVQWAGTIVKRTRKWILVENQMGKSKKFHVPPRQNAYLRAGDSVVVSYFRRTKMVVKVE
jgi:hypothetical protein